MFKESFPFDKFQSTEINKKSLHTSSRTTRQIRACKLRLRHSFKKKTVNSIYLPLNISYLKIEFKLFSFICLKIFQNLSNQIDSKYEYLQFITCTKGWNNHLINHIITSFNLARFVFSSSYSASLVFLFFETTRIEISCVTEILRETTRSQSFRLYMLLLGGEKYLSLFYLCSSLIIFFLKLYFYSSLDCINVIPFCRCIYFKDLVTF